MTIDDFCDITGQRQQSLLESAQINRSTLSMWRNGKQTPSLFNVIVLFLISDGHIEVMDLLSEKDSYLLTQFLDRVPKDRLSELKVELQAGFNKYSDKVITDYLDDEDLL